MYRNLHKAFTTELFVFVCLFVGCVVVSQGTDHNSRRLGGALAKYYLI